MSELFGSLFKRMSVYTWRVRGLLYAFLLVLVAQLGVILFFEIDTLHIFGVGAQAAIVIAFLVCEGMERMTYIEDRKKRSLIARASRIEEIQSRRVFQQQSIIKILADNTLASGDRDASYRLILQTASRVLKTSSTSFWRYEEHQLSCITTYDADAKLFTESEQQHVSGGLRVYFDGVRVVSFVRQSESPLAVILAANSAAGLATPVYHHGEFVGALVCNSLTVRRWKLDEQDFLASLGDVAALIHEITARKKAEREARESARFLRQVIDTDPNLIFVKDVQGRFTLVNKAMLEVFDVPMNEILGKSDFDLNMPTHQAEAFQRADKEVLTNGHEVMISDESLTDRRGKTLRLQTVKRPLTDLSGRVTHVLGVACDITARKELEDRLAQKQKLEAVGQLAGGIAHDFNNLLTGVLGYSKLIRDAAHDREIEEHADSISRIAQKASDLTEQLLAFARKGKKRSISVNINQIIEDTITIIARTISPDITVATELSAESPLVTGDPSQLQQVILNLCINARDAMTRDISGVQGGRLLVGTRMRTREAVSLSHSSVLLRSPVEYIEIYVTDTGCGMSPETLSRCFEPFYTTKSDCQGAGMGLAMVYGIVETHHGFISVESSPYFGSTFRIYLPRATAASITPLLEMGLPSIARGEGRILLVDDHEEIRDVTKQMLKTLGYHVDTARDGVEAVNLLLSDKRYELIVLDVIMPRMSGKECFKEIRRICPKCPVVFSTGYLGNHALSEELSMPHTSFVQKPYRLEQLSQVVASLMDQNSHESQGYLQ